MKNKLISAITAAFMCAPAYSATKHVSAQDSPVFNLSELTPVPATSVNKVSQAESKNLVSRFKVEKGLESKPYHYIIELKEQAVAQYDGGINNLKATNPSRDPRLLFATTGGRPVAQKLDVTSHAVKAYVGYLETQQGSFLNEARQVVANLQPIRTYKYGLNAVAVRATPEEAKRLSELPGVLKVKRETFHRLHTDVGPNKIGAPKIWDGSATTSGVGAHGAGIVIGVIDTGINTDHASFADIGADGYDHSNPLGAGNYLGDCAKDFAELCNDKLIGVYSYPEITSVYLDTSIFPVDLPQNGEDYNGHGSHTASTAGGNILKNVTVVGPDAGKIESDGAPTEVIFEQVSGVAPHANIVSYQVCYPGDVSAGDTYGSCSSIAILAAIEDAIKDKVDVINFSISSGGNPWDSPEDSMFLSARNAGIFVATSAGNSGPNPETSAKHAPWYTVVAAATHGRVVIYDKELKDFSGGESDLAALSGKSNSSGITAPIVYAGNFSNSNAPQSDPALCGAPFPEGSFDGQIVVCDRGGSIARVFKAENVKAGGAGGFVLANRNGGAADIASDSYVLPGIHIDAEQGNALKSWLGTGSGHTGTITAAEGNVEVSQGDDIAGFSSRGPNTSISTITPMLAAPGVDIYAAYADQMFGHDGFLPGATDFHFISGTSMSSPHVAGAAALLKSANPGWTPDNIRSALMLTSSTDMRKEDGTTAADWFDMGAGRIQVDKANQTGLLMDETDANYRNANPERTGGDPRTLNIPSMADNDCLGVCSWKRTVTATKDGTWSANAEALSEGVNISVSPSSFSLRKGQQQEIRVTVDAFATSSSDWLFGRLNLTSPSSPDLHMPIAVKASASNLPTELYFNTNRDQDSFLLTDRLARNIETFSYKSYGLAKATLHSQSLSVAETPPTSFEERLEGSQVYLIDVPDGAKRLVSEFLDSPTFNMYVGFDENGDGIPQSGESIKFSRRKVDLSELKTGNYWVSVINEAANETGDLAEFTLATAVVENNSSESLLASTETDAIAQLTPFDIRFAWNIPNSQQGDKYYGVIELGSNTDRVNDLATIAIDLTREQDDVQLSTNIEAGKRYHVGDIIDVNIDVIPNYSSEQRDYKLSIQLPESMELVTESNDSVQVLDQNNLEWTPSLQALESKKPGYKITTSATDPHCVQPIPSNGNDPYFYLTEGGFPTSGVDGNEVLARFEARATFLGKTYETFTVSDNGFITFGEVEGQTHINQLMPNSDTPNGLLAPFWRDMQFDIANGSTLTVANFGDSLTVVEFYKMKTTYEVDGKQVEDQISFEVFFINNRAYPYKPHIVYLYRDAKHIQGDKIPTSIGYENLSGTGGSTLYHRPFVGSGETPIGSIAEDINENLNICFYPQETSHGSESLIVQARVKAQGKQGESDIVVTSSLPGIPGTVEITKTLAADVIVEGAPEVLINGVAEYSIKVEENSSLSLTGTAIDPNGDEVNIEWNQSAGPAVTLTEVSSGNVEVNIPEVSTDEVVQLEMLAIEAHSGKISKAVANITVVNGNDTSGGSSGIYLLLCLPLVWLRRKR